MLVKPGVSEDGRMLEGICDKERNLFVMEVAGIQMELRCVMRDNSSSDGSSSNGIQFHQADEAD